MRQNSSLKIEFQIHFDFVPNFVCKYYVQVFCFDFEMQASTIAAKELFLMSTKKMFSLVFARTLCAVSFQILVFLLAAGTIVAQSNVVKTDQTKPPQQDKQSAPQKDDVAPEIKEKAIKLLEVAARETEQFAAPQNRVKSQIVVAGLLWERDEPAARAVFQKGLDELQAMFSDFAATTADEEEGENKDYAKRYALGELRREYLLALAARDPKSALLALSSLRLLQPVSKAQYDPLKADELELQIASAVIKKDPQQAYELALKTLKETVTHTTMTTLTDLYKNNSELGAKFARDILAKLKTSKIRPIANKNIASESALKEANSNSTVSTDETNYIELSQVAQFMTTAEQLNRRAARSKEKQELALTDAEMRELADFIGQSFNRQDATEPWVIASAIPLIAKYSPTVAQSIKRKLNAQQLQLLAGYGGSGDDYYQERDEKTFDEIVTDADKLTAAPERDMRYADAVQKALEKNELEKAFEIAAKIKDKASYGHVFENLKTTTPLIKARRGDVAEVRKLLFAIKKDDEKVAALTELVVALANKGEKEAAGKLMDEANQMLPARLKRKPNLETTLKIGGAYSLLEPERGFGLIEDSIAQMNDLIAAGVLIDEFYDYGTTEKEEILFATMERQAALHITNAAATIKNLAKVDFERTVKLADKFARPEIGIFVRLKVIQLLLDPEALEREQKMRELYQNEYADH